MTTASERATAAVQRPPVKRVCCPNCEATFDLNKIGKPRSPEQHRRFFGLVRAAYEHFPEGGYDGFIPDSTEHMRHWLICKAGPAYRTVQQHNVCDTGNFVLNARLLGVIEDIIATDKSPKFARWVGLTLTVFRPKSIRYHTMSHNKFNALNQAVEDVLKEVFGITGDELLEKAKQNI